MVSIDKINSSVSVTAIKYLYSALVSIGKINVSQGLFVRYHPRLLFSIVPMVTLWIMGRMGPLPIHLSRTPVRRTRFTVLVYNEHQSDENVLVVFVYNEHRLTVFIYNEHQSNEHEPFVFVYDEHQSDEHRPFVFVYDEHQSDEHGPFVFVYDEHQSDEHGPFVFVYDEHQSDEHGLAVFVYDHSFVSAGR